MKMCKLCMEKEYMEYPKAHFGLLFKYTFQAIKLKVFGISNN